MLNGPIVIIIVVVVVVVVVSIVINFELMARWSSLLFRVFRKPKF